MLFFLVACLTTPAEYRSLLLDAQDGDDDGQAAALYEGQDCDDSDPLVGAGFEELCDGLDNDCDGVVDEGVPDAPIWFLDGDSDGFGDDSETLGACSEPDGYTDQGGDCDDSRPQVRPGQEEVCGNGLDDDCDGSAGSCWDPLSEAATVPTDPVQGIAWGEGLGELLVVEHAAYRLVGTDLTMRVEAFPEHFAMLVELVAADEVVAFGKREGEGMCLFDADGVGLLNPTEWACDANMKEGPVYVVGETLCGHLDHVVCLDPDLGPEGIPVTGRAGVGGVGLFDGRNPHLGVAEGNVVSIHTESEILHGETPSQEVPLSGAPDSICLLEDTIAWTTSSGTFLTRGDSEVRLSETGGDLQCSPFGAGLVLQIPPTGDALIVHNASVLAGVELEPIVVELKEADVFLRNRAAISHDDTQAWLNWVAADTLWRMELGPGL